MELYLGNSLLHNYDKEIKGEIIKIDGEDYYKISNYDEMPPFFISVSSSSDHWMYVSGKGGLTCGRKDPENALFPYYTDDKIHDAFETTGPKSIFIARRKGKACLWEPFNPDRGIYLVERNIYRSITGNKLIFEEINTDLHLSYRYTWLNSDLYGFIKQSQLVNNSQENVELEFTDGIRNILPYGVNRGLQSNMSTLVDGYKQCELVEKPGLGIYTLSSILTDKAEPSEALKATTVWQAGLKNPKYLLSERQLNNFVKGRNLETETFIKGQRGAFFVNAKDSVEPGQELTWYIIAEVCQGPTDVPELISQIASGTILDEVIKDIQRGTGRLKNLVALADGQQLTSDKLNTSRHFSNTLYNIMRGGIFNDQYFIDKEDFTAFVKNWNKIIFERHQGFLEMLNDKNSLNELQKAIAERNDPDLERLVLEYLPLTFSRRHGDPSRPWNVFSIRVKKEDGEENLYYQGNWRDIFQNWEALSLSYPEFIESFIAKFLNASTADGYNPYRVTKDGIDWELLDPDDPWSNIGYWGDHQVIYLQKLLELSFKYHPQKLLSFLAKEAFVYANVPYKIKGYDALINDPVNSIEFNDLSAQNIERHLARLGADGKMLLDDEGLPYKVYMLEKLLVTALSKLSNFVPDGGIWMNTQRPEWNDANNALVGNGVSVVTLYYLRRFLSFFQKLIMPGQGQDKFQVSTEVAVLLEEQKQVFSNYREQIKGVINNKTRKEIVDGLGKAGEDYRNKIYGGLSNRKEAVFRNDIHDFVGLALDFIDHTIQNSKRHDGLYHSYNLVHFGLDGFAIEHLYEMLEGQVAVLSSGILTVNESLDLLELLRKSKMYTESQNSYMLYPDKKLPGFLEKNIIPDSKVQSSAWIQEEIRKGRKEFIVKDPGGKVHFNGCYRNSEGLRLALLKDISMPYDVINEACELFEDIFKHKQFTGRSGTFYKYEGLGSIYWHMVSKLLLAVQEVGQKALKEGMDKAVLDKIRNHYYDIKAGIGAHKKPDEYGSFPTEPYSHTPSFAGVQQPGMTGQVKEDIITRFGEFGVQAEQGIISFNPALLNRAEYLRYNMNWNFQRNGKTEVIKLQHGELGFSLCGIPVIYQLKGKNGVTILRKDGKVTRFGENQLDKDVSAAVFNRSVDIDRIIVQFGSNLE